MVLAALERDVAAALTARSLAVVGAGGAVSSLRTRTLAPWAMGVRAVLEAELVLPTQVLRRKSCES
jgi:hypothetical protein